MYWYGPKVVNNHAAGGYFISNFIGKFSNGNNFIMLKILVFPFSVINAAFAPIELLHLYHLALEVYIDGKVLILLNLLLMVYTYCSVPFRED